MSKANHHGFQGAFRRNPKQMVGIGKPTLSFEKKPILKVAL
jgi:hypothetical protein